MAEEEQNFLGRQQVFLQQGVPAAGSAPGVPAGVQKTPDRKVLGSPGVQGSPKKVKLQTFRRFFLNRIIK